MKKVIITISIIGLSILAIKIGNIILRYTNDDYRAKKQIETWNSRLAEIKGKDVTNQLDTNCRMRLSLTEDTLKFEIENIGEHGDGYDVEFLYPKFGGNGSKIYQLNKELELLVFDELSNSKTYFSKHNKEYIEEFDDVKEEEKYNWRDLEEVELIMNNNEIVSAVHHDFELKSGGAIWFGDRIGFNFDLVNKKKNYFRRTI